jgi:hypothetical protein
MSAAAARAELDRRIEDVESGYEYLLAYAAQGRETDKGGAGGSVVREHLARMARALEGLGAAAGECAAAIDPELPAAAADFLAALDADARVARSAIALVLARPDVSSQLVDNLNATIHLRALLTDLFVVDEALKIKAAP